MRMRMLYHEGAIVRCWRGHCEIGAGGEGIARDAAYVIDTGQRYVNVYNRKNGVVVTSIDIRRQWPSLKQKARLTLVMARTVVELARRLSMLPFPLPKKVDPKRLAMSQTTLARATCLVRMRLELPLDVVRIVWDFLYDAYDERVNAFVE